MLHLDDFRRFEPDDNAAQERDREIDAIGGQIVETQESIDRLLDTLETVQSEAAEQRLAALDAKLTDLKVKRDELREKQAIVSEPSTSTASDLMTEYLAVYEGRDIPEDKAEAMRDVIAHISTEIRRVVQRVEVEKGKPIRVIPRSDD